MRDIADSVSSRLSPGARRKLSRLAPVRLVYRGVVLWHEHSAARWPCATCARGRQVANMTLITDEARATGVLPELSAREGGRYAPFRERPLDHWWPGNEIGVAVIERAP